MSDQLENKAVEILTSIQEATRAAGDFALQQLPEIAQTYVIYGRVKTSVSSLFLLSCAVGFACLTRWAHKNPWNTSDYSWDQGKKRSDSNILVMFVAGFLSFFTATMAVSRFDWLVWLAPKVWLIKELAGLVKGA